ncbi:amidohydrolase family protein [Bacteroidota bacterium]
MAKKSRREFIKNTSLVSMSALLVGSSQFPRIYSVFGGFDILILNGTVIDGTGKKAYKADVGILGDKITAVGNLTNANAGRKIDASGLYIVPGFIDIHSHTDLDLIANPKAESKVRQGVTLEVCGQDGSSYGSMSDKRAFGLSKRYDLKKPWRYIGDFLEDFSNREFCLNLATMVGLGTIRQLVVGMDDRPATAEEIRKMKKEVEHAVMDGAVGVSTGLEYTPGSFASTKELIEMCKAAPEKGRLYATHMRNEDNFVEEAVDEAIKIAQSSGSRLQISHLKVSGKTNWHKADSVLGKIDVAIDKGLEIHADRYTYIAYHTTLANLYPLWSRDGGSEKFIERLKDTSLKDTLKEFAEKKVQNLDGGWNGVLLSSIGGDDLKKYQGKTIKQISEEEGEDPFIMATELIIESGNNTNMVGFGMEDESTDKVIAHPRVMIASDAGSHAPYPPMNKSIAHPRAYGTFPRAIAEYVREKKICSLEEMIGKMSSMPADKLHIKDRGRIIEGNKADIVLFDYGKIKDKATFINSHQYPEGIPYVLVNGKLVINKGEHSGAMPGKVIKG